MKYFLLFLPFVLLACSQPKYGPEYNPERIKRGIPIIEDGWYESTHSEKEHTIWGDGELLDVKRIYHIRKYLDLKGEEIQKESDAFVKVINDTLSYELKTQYYYVYKNKPWKCILNKFRNINWDEESITPLSLSQADSVLASWGLSRTGK